MKKLTIEEEINFNLNCYIASVQDKQATVNNLIDLVKRSIDEYYALTPYALTALSKLLGIGFVVNDGIAIKAVIEKKEAK